MMRLLMVLTMVALVATVTIPALASERAAQDIGLGVEELTPPPAPVIESVTVVADTTLCADDDLECVVRAHHMNTGQEAN